MADFNDFRQFSVTSRPSDINGRKVYESAYYDRDNKAFERAIKSAVSKEAQIYFGNKTITKGGKEQIDIFIHSDNPADVPNARRAMQQIEGKLPRDYSITSKRELDVEKLASLIKDDKTSGKEEKRRETEKNDQNFLKTILHLSRMITSLVGLTSVARRILTAVLTMSSRSVKEATMAHGLGLSYDTVRQFDQIETRSNMDSGTMTNAVTDLQNKFGNITTLDTGALEALAVVMGSGIKNLALTGVDPTRTEDLLADILNAFNTRAEQGVNSIGQYVGTDDARKELFSYLNKISPAVAGIFNKMQEQDSNVNSIYRNKFDVTDYASWKDALLSGVTDFTPAQRGLEQTLGEYKNSIDALIKQLKEKITVAVAPDLIAVLRKISNIRWGNSATENADINKENFEDNNKYISELKQGLAMLPENEEGLPESEAVEVRTYRSLFKNEIARAEKENKRYSEGKNVDSVRRTLNELGVNAGKIIYEGEGLKLHFKQYDRKGLENALLEAGMEQEEIDNLITKGVNDEVYSKSDKERREDKKKELKDKWDEEVEKQERQAKADVNAEWDKDKSHYGESRDTTNTNYMNAVAEKLRTKGWKVTRNRYNKDRLEYHKPEYKEPSNRELTKLINQDIADEKQDKKQDEDLIIKILLDAVNANGLAKNYYYKRIPELSALAGEESKYNAYPYIDASLITQKLIEAGSNTQAKVWGQTTETEGDKHFTLTLKIVDEYGNEKGTYNMFEGSGLSLESGLYDTFTYNVSAKQVERVERVNSAGTVAK